MGFFQPGDAEQNTSGTKTPSPADQAMAKFRAEILGRLLNAQAGNRPTFSSFVHGGPASRPVPEGLGNGMADVLAAMAQPGAFTSSAQGQQTLQGPAPSTLSEIIGGGLAVGQILQMLGGAKGIGGILGVLGDNTPEGSAGSNASVTTTGNPALDALIFGQYGGGTNTDAMIPGGSVSNLPSDYPGLNDGGAGFWASLFG